MRLGDMHHVSGWTNENVYHDLPFTMCGVFIIIAVVKATRGFVYGGWHTL